MSVDDGLLAADDPAPGPESGHQSSLHYPNVYAFVEDFLAVVYARHYEPSGSWRWCAQWWEHPEAVSRLDALWQAFEVLRQEGGTGPAMWWRDYADPTMAALTAPDGPFQLCRSGTEQRHQNPEDLPCSSLPAGLLALSGASLPSSS